MSLPRICIGNLCRCWHCLRAIPPHSRGSAKSLYTYVVFGSVLSTQSRTSYSLPKGLFVSSFLSIRPVSFVVHTFISTLSCSLGVHKMHRLHFCSCSFTLLSKVSLNKSLITVTPSIFSVSHCFGSSQELQCFKYQIVFSVYTLFICTFICIEI